MSTASLHHWLEVVQHGGANGPTPKDRRRATEHAMSFLIKAQWLQQEAQAEGVSEAKLDRLTTQRASRRALPVGRGATRVDAELRVRLDLIAEALSARHRNIGKPITEPQVADFYDAHRSQFQTPAVWHTLMVVTHGSRAALAARAQLRRGADWAAVAKRWSTDSSALAGGADAVVEGVQSRPLVHAVLSAARGRLTGPVQAPRAAEPSSHDYYLFKVIDGHAGSIQPLSQVAPQIRQMLLEQAQNQALAAFTREYEMHWRARTLCAAAYVAPPCRNYAAATHER